MTESSLAHMQIADGCWMVGRRNINNLLQCNTYLRSFDAGTSKALHWCVDPGSQIDYPTIQINITSLIGSLRELRLFSINHQDPDVCGNLGYLTNENERLTGLVTEDAWRLVRHLNTYPKHLYYTNLANGSRIKLTSGQTIQFVPTPFCHFRGAVAFYDPESRALFTGDLFAGLNELGRVQLLGDEQDWPGISMFHQIYMPSREAIQYAIRQVRALDPPVEVIAPQHGFVLTGDFMHTVLERLEQLPVGMECVSKELDDAFHSGYCEVFSELLHEASLQLGDDEVRRRLEALTEDHLLSSLIRITSTDIELTGPGIKAIPLLVHELCRDQFDAFRNIMRSHALQGCLRRELPIPQMGIGVEEGGAGE